MRMIFIAAVCGAFCLVSCGGGEKEKLPSITAKLVEENHHLSIVLHNNSDTCFVICKRNFYDPIQCLDVRRASDTTEFSTGLLFGGVQSGVMRTIITMDDFVNLDTGQELRLPVDLRPVRKDVGAGKPVLVSVYFKNIDPFACSRVDVMNYDKMTQNYCKLLHFVPNRSLHYWIGEVRTHYLPVNLRYYVVRQQKIAKKRAPREIVVRRSRTNPLKRKVF